MGHSLLSILSPNLGVPEATRGSEPKDRGDSASAEPSENSIFSKFLKRRDVMNNGSAQDTRSKSSARTKPEDSNADIAKTGHKTAPEKSANGPEDTQEERPEDAMDEEAEATTEPTDVQAGEDAKSEFETSDDQLDASETTDAVAVPDPAKDTAVESMLMGFFAGQVPLVPQAPGGFGDAAIAVTVTSAPAPTPTDINASPSLPLASDTQILPTETANTAAVPTDATETTKEVAPAIADFSKLLTSAMAAPAAATIPSQAATQQAATETVKATEPKAQPQPIMTVANTASEEDATAAKPEDTPSILTLPRRLGRQEPVLSNNHMPTPETSDSGAPGANASGSAAGMTPTVLRIAANIAANIAESESADVEAVSATGETSASATPAAAPASTSTSATTPTKFELSGAAPSSPAADQILAHVASLPKGKGTQFSLQLEPLHLGKVDVVMSIQHDGALHMQIQAESRETLAALQRDASQLERSLQDLGLKTDGSSLQFSLKQEGQQNPAFAQFDQNRQNGNGQGSNGQGEAGRNNTDTQIRPLGTVAYRSASQPDGLDIHV